MLPSTIYSDAFSEILIPSGCHTSELAPYPCLSVSGGRLSDHLRAAACRRNFSDTPQLAAAEISLFLNINLLQCYEKLRSGGSLSAEECIAIESDKFESYQLAALAVRLLEKSILPQEAALLNWIAKQFVPIAVYLSFCYQDHPLFASVGLTASYRTFLQNVDHLYIRLLKNTSSRSVDREGIYAVVSRVTSQTIDLNFLAIWLTLICIHGLSDSDTESLTYGLRDSGPVYDYRQDFQNRCLVRRYPTGGLSEKIALIMPSLIASFAEEYPVASPFLVARSLGFTGGTWDKLSAIPGFIFPHPGEETKSVLEACHVAMTVTNGDANPADRFLYQFRSVTGTIESLPLIVASIASKQMSFPVDHLLLDVRYGTGAFVKTLHGAKSLSDQMIRILETNGISTTSCLTQMEQPDGIAVGNTVEVCEAIAVMATSPSEHWNVQALSEQKQQVVKLFARLMHQAFPDEPEIFWRNEAIKKFQTGTVLKVFGKVLEAHMVGRDLAKELIDTMGASFLPRQIPLQIRSDVNGILVSMDQVKIGHTVNVLMGAGGNHFCGNFDPISGVLLRKRLGDRVLKGDILVEAFIANESHVSGLETIVATSLQQAFVIL